MDAGPFSGSIRNATQGSYLLLYRTEIERLRQNTTFSPPQKRELPSIYNEYEDTSVISLHHIFCSDSKYCFFLHRKEVTK